jgi:hypothetical protein
MQADHDENGRIIYHWLLDNGADPTDEAVLFLMDE